MPGRVALNLPPRVVESARAAQYANRARLDARTTDERIQAKTVQRHAAAQRAQPLPEDRVGGVLEFPQRGVARIWRRPRAFGEVDVAVGWQQVSRSQPAPSPSIPNPYDPSIDGPLSGTDSASGAMTFSALLGSGDGSRWEAIGITLPWSFSFAYSYGPGPQSVWRGQAYSEAATTNHEFRQIAVTLPLGGNRLLWLMVIAQYTLTYADTHSAPYSGSVTTAVPFFTARIIGERSVEPLAAPVPAFMLAEIQARATQLVQVTQGAPLPPQYYRLDTWGRPVTQAYVDAADLSIGGTSIGINPAGLDANLDFSRLVSSNAYEGLTTFAGQPMTAAQAKAAYKAFSGNSEIPVLGYRRDARALPYPQNERGEFGVMPGVSVTDLTFPAVDALEDEVERAPASGATAPGGPHQILVGYDFHGGNYCRDKLQALGITLS